MNKEGAEAEPAAEDILFLCRKKGCVLVSERIVSLPLSVKQHSRSPSSSQTEDFDR